jgi:N-acetylmuramoyl-L-alanine amidase
LVHGQNTLKKQITTVVIDPGHGGKDPGTVVKKVYEKDIVLAIALKLGNYIKKNIPDVKVIYTRSTDVFIPLEERAEIANKNQADLFISIHANWNKNTEAHGTETYAMGLSKAKDNLEVAQKENSVILLEEDYTMKYQGYDPNSPESYIIFSLFQNKYIEQSLNFASYVQTQFKEKAQRHDREVKQAGFLVLWKTTMPSVLIEVGFISNPQEQKFLLSPYGQDLIASAIYRAFKNYKNDIENRSVYATTDNTEPNTDTLIEGNEPVKLKNDDTLANTDTASDNNVEFLIQISSSKNSISLNSDFFKGLPNVEEFKSESNYKYAVGRKSRYEEVVEYSKIVKNYFPDAFIIAVRNGKIIPLKEVLKEIKD